MALILAASTPVTSKSQQNSRDFRLQVRIWKLAIYHGQKRAGGIPVTRKVESWIIIGGKSGKCYRVSSKSISHSFNTISRWLKI